MPASIKFSSQSQKWLSDLAARKRKPVAPATLHAFGTYVRRLLPLIGPDTELATIDNGAMKALVTKLVAEKLSPKTITEMLATVKQIVGSAVDANGNQPVIPAHLEFQIHRRPSNWEAEAAVRHERGC